MVVFHEFGTGKVDRLLTGPLFYGGRIMNAKEIFELAKQGYKPNEIMELNSMMKQCDQEDVSNNEETEIEPEEKPEGNPEEKPEGKSEESEKKLEGQPEENLEDKIKDLEEKLKKAQKENTQKDMSGNEPSNDEKMADIVKGFF